MENEFENPFLDMNDIDLVRIYDDYEEWCRTGIIREGTGLAALRDQYNEAFGPSSIVAMEHDFLLECTKRFYANFIYN